MCRGVWINKLSAEFATCSSAVNELQGGPCTPTVVVCGQGKGVHNRGPGSSSGNRRNPQHPQGAAASDPNAAPHRSPALAPMVVGQGMMHQGKHGREHDREAASRRCSHLLWGFGLSGCAGVYAALRITVLHHEVAGVGPEMPDSKYRPLVVALHPCIRAAAGPFLPVLDVCTLGRRCLTLGWFYGICLCALGCDNWNIPSSCHCARGKAATQNCM